MSFICPGCGVYCDCPDCDWSIYLDDQIAREAEMVVDESTTCLVPQAATD